METTTAGMPLSRVQLDRAAGVLLGVGCGDALGAPHEFGPPLEDTVPLTMSGGGTFGWEPGEWTDDTSMALAIAEVAAGGADLLDAAAQDRIAVRWAGWAADAKDVGAQTRSVLTAGRRAAAARGASGPSAADLRAAAEAEHRRAGRSGGNGSLMRTAPVALAHLDDEEALVRAASELSAVTHHDPEAGEACVLWCLAIRHGVLHGTLDGLRLGLGHLPPDRAAVWAERLDRAEAGAPRDFSHNGWVVEALQGAWSAIAGTAADGAEDADRAEHVRRGIEAAVRGGYDTDTVAAIAGALLGAVHGASAVPAAWRRDLHGWPGLRARDLVRLAVVAARGGSPDDEEWTRVWGGLGDEADAG